MSSSARAAARWPRTRCGRCAAPASTPPVELVETSPVLRARPGRAAARRCWHDDLATLPGDGPLLVVANEFFDALPVRQFDAGGRELDRRLARRPLRPRGEVETRDLARVARRSSRDLARRLAAQGGAALIVDYGHDRPGRGDTLQAVSRHAYADPFEAPGERDLTAHVDFAALAGSRARRASRVFGPVDAGRLARRDGDRPARRRARQAAPERTEEIVAARDRLTAPGQMGRLFKVMALVAPGWPEPAGF